ncbi:hypothetical protein [Falsibacillus pallidus]|uniref:Uncharacterized protein n=1 Tax=Falsibacillus pallidus TaxID=493781 RepID=A0A370GH99_9BACI|nr:hypothetical protein [Falsibacillus pallidus]RDI43031.1 hypothetical protein DFR59_10481 [Falsibacillus pallidus]
MLASESVLEKLKDIEAQLDQLEKDIQDRVSSKLKADAMEIHTKMDVHLNRMDELMGIQETAKLQGNVFLNGLKLEFS